MQFAEQFQDLLVLMLIAASIISAALGEYPASITIIAILLGRGRWVDEWLGEVCRRSLDLSLSFDWFGWSVVRLKENACMMCSLFLQQMRFLA